MYINSEHQILSKIFNLEKISTVLKYLHHYFYKITKYTMQKYSVFFIYKRQAILDQERRDRELAMRLAQDEGQAQVVEEQNKMFVQFCVKLI